MHTCAHHACTHVWLHLQAQAYGLHHCVPLLVHLLCALSLVRNPQARDVLLTASGDTTVRVWDVRQPAPSLVLQAHGHEVRGQAHT